MNVLTTAPEQWKLLLRDFQRALQAENKSPRTIGIYLRAALRLARAYPNIDPRDIDRRQIRDHIASLIEDTSAGNAHTHYRSLQQWFAFLLAEREIDTSPMVNMKPPIVPETTIPVVPVGVIREVIATCHGDDFVARRDEAIIRTFFDTGVRLSEIIVILNDVDLAIDALRVLGKGRKIRTVPFSPTTARTISRYLRARSKHRHANRPELWLGERGRGPLTPNGIAQMFRRRGRLAGVDTLVGGQFHPHLARHTFSHEFLAAGGSESDLMLLMGWSSPSMPRRYGVSAATERAHTAARRLHLGDRF